MELKQITNHICNGKLISKEEAMALLNADLDELCFHANEIRKHFCQDSFDLCSIINGKSGLCSENCVFCAQSSHYKTNVEEYKILPLHKIEEEAKHNAKKGVQRFSIVTSGKKLSPKECDTICAIYAHLNKNVNISLCASSGLLDYAQLKQLYQSGVKRYHNNLETSKRFFPKVCTTHAYEDKITTLKLARDAGLQLCSGGIIGLGEDDEDRVDLAFQLRALEVKSIPINFLNPIEGTPLAKQTKITLDEAKRIVAIFRFILPDAHIRLAGGRQLFQDMGAELFECGANATITGDMLTTSGLSIDEDLHTIKQLGFRVSEHE